MFVCFYYVYICTFLSLPSNIVFLFIIIPLIYTKQTADFNSLNDEVQIKKSLKVYCEVINNEMITTKRNFFYLQMK